MASYGADDIQNVWNNLIPSSLTVTPWQCKLAEAIYIKTVDPKLKSWGGAQGWNTWIIDQMNKAYLVMPTVDNIVNKTKVSPAIAQAFIEYYPSYAGSDVREGIVAAGIDAVTGGFKAAPKLANSLPLIVGILAVGIAGYFIFAGKAGTKLTPF
jgi:hypothetical protein